MNSAEEKQGRLRPHRWLIQFIGVIVPRRLRADWTQEWEAELRFRELLLADWDKLNWRTKLDLLRRSLGAFWDALALQPQRLEDEMFQDLRYGLRMLLKDKGFTAVAVLTLALGIGANTAMFSVLNTYLFRPLPYPNSDRLVRIYRTSPHSQSWPHSPGNFFDYRAQNSVFEYMAAFSQPSINLGEPGETAERVQCITATADFFQALGVQPALGRVFTAEEEMIPINGVVVLSHPYWMRRFGGDPNIIGRKVLLNGWEAEIIGVMPPGVEHPLLWNTVDMWGPQAFTAESRRERGSNYLQAFGRLKPGVSIQQAQEAMAGLAANLAREHPDNSEDSLRLEPLQRSMSDDIGRTIMWFTFGLAGFVLLIGCTNLANLQLVRTAGRAREFAVRAALGAGRARLLRQSLTESVAVSLIGGALSLLFAQWGTGFISRGLFSELPGGRVTLDFRVFGFAFLSSLLTGLAFGAVPALLASRADVSQALRHNARGSTASPAHHRLRHVLIVGEVAFALILLAGAGLFLRGLQRFTRLDPGWKVDGLVSAQVGVQGPNYVNAPQRAAFVRQLEERLSVLPGVQQVSVSGSQPVFGFGNSGAIVIEGQPEPPPGQWPEVSVESVSPRYFETLGVRLLEGRAFTAADTADRPAIVIINKTTAQHFWPNESSIGKRLGNPGSEAHWKEVVGVVNDMRFPGNLKQPDTRFQAFVPIAVSPPWGSVTVALRTSEAPEGLTNTLRSAVGELDPIQSVYQIQGVRGLVTQGLGSISLLGKLLGAFAILGLALAAIGIYGVTSYSVAQRTGEIGIRMALGAQQKDVLRLVLGKGARLSLFGVILGLGGGYAVARLLDTQIPTLPTHDPGALAGVALILFAVALLACYLPARRATKVDPMVALRHE